MIKSNIGSGSSEVIIIMAMIVYFTFMGYIGGALGYTPTQVGTVGSWSIPYVHVDTGWTAFFTGTLDVLIAVLNVFIWVLQALVAYACLVGYSFGGDTPVWLTGIIFTPIAFGLGWMILSLVRGRAT